MNAPQPVVVVAATKIAPLPNEKCFFIFSEPGRWKILSQLRPKFDARYDGTGYLIKADHKEELEAFCAHYKLTVIEHDAPDNFDALPYYDPIDLHIDEREKLERELADILKEANITYATFESLHTEPKRLQIKQSPLAGKIEPLVRKHKTICGKITLLTNKKNTSEAILQSDRQLSLIEDYQEELLSYALKTPFEQIIADGFNPTSIEPALFDERYVSIVEALKSCWENEIQVSIAEIVIASGNESEQLHKLVQRIFERSPITKGQAEERIEAINRKRAHKKLNDLRTVIAEKIESNAPTHETAELIQKEINVIQEGSVTFFPQSHYLHTIVEELNDSKNQITPTKIPSLDLLLGGGLKESELGVLSGGAGSGKTAFALQVADSIAMNGHAAIYISIEIGKNKLTERSFKRLGYPFRELPAHEKLLRAITEYQKFADNVYIIKGRHGMRVSEIKNIVLHVRSRRKNKKILLIIDPFQRLGTGDERIDYNNETQKINRLCEQIKELTESLKVPILALSDTVKDHKNNKSGEGASRGTYMIDHTADYVMLLRTSRDAAKALYGENVPSEDPEDPLFNKVKTELATVKYNQGGRYSLSGDFDKYASLVTSKNRDGAKFSPLFVYKPDSHLFIDTELWKNM